MSDTVSTSQITDLRIGQRMRDVVSGFAGIATARFDHLNGTIQFALQPESDGKSRPDTIGIDYQILEVVDQGIVDRTVPPVETPIRLGKTVRDSVSGYVGVATVKITSLNGCVAFYVIGKAGGDDTAKPRHVDAFRLTVVEPETAETKALAQTERPLGRTGGASVTGMNFGS